MEGQWTLLRNSLKVSRKNLQIKQLSYNGPSFKGTNATTVLKYLLSKNKYKQTKIFIIFKKQTRIISIISQHFLTINCFKSILKTNGIFNYLCKEIIFVF